MTDTISISDRMTSSAVSSSSTSLNVPTTIPEELNAIQQKTTTISTIAVQCLNCRIVVALLQSRATLTLRVLESFPSFHTVGNGIEESEQMLKEHNNVLDKLQKIESPVEELLRKVDSSLVSNPNPEVYIAMAECLGQAWKDLNDMLERRRELLDLGHRFHRERLECLAKFKDPEQGDRRRETMKLYADIVTTGKAIIEHMHEIEDSASSIVQMENWLEDLWKQMTEWKQDLQMKQKSINEDNLYDDLMKELDDIMRSSDENPEECRRRLLFLITRVEQVIEFTDTTKTETLIRKCYEQLDKLNKYLEHSLDIHEFLLNNNQLHGDNFKEDHQQYLRNVDNVATVDEELKNVLKIRLQIRDEYEYILEHVLDFEDDAEIEKRLTKDLPLAGGLEIKGALNTIKDKRTQLQNELYYKFKPQIDGIEQCMFDIGDIATLKTLLEKTVQLQHEISQNTSKFNGKEHLLSTCSSLRNQLESKIDNLHSVHRFLFEHRDLVEPDFQKLHEEQLLKVVYELQQHHELESRFHTRLGIRQLYDDMLNVPLEYEEEQVEQLLGEDPTLDISKALVNYHQSRKIDELLATLDFPLPENLETARNDFNDFKSFETLLEAIQNPPEDLIQKSKIKKENILKCIELYEILGRIDRYEFIPRVEQLELELFGSSTYAEALQEELKRSQESHDKVVEEVPPPIPPPPSAEALSRKGTPSPAPFVPPRPTSTSIETQTDEQQALASPEYYYSPVPGFVSPPPLMSPELFARQTEQLITEIIEQKLLEREQHQQMLAVIKPTPMHEMETQTFEEQPIELSHGETQTVVLPARSNYTQTDDRQPYEFITSPPPTPEPGVEIETQTMEQIPSSTAVETQTFTYQILANRQTQTPAEFIRPLRTPGFSVETQTIPSPPRTPKPVPPPGIDIPHPVMTTTVDHHEVDTQTSGLPRFLANMETQTQSEPVEVGPAGEVVGDVPPLHTFTSEKTHTFVHELIEKSTHVPVPGEPVFYEKGDGKLVQEMETQTDTIADEQPQQVVLPTPEVAKLYQNSESQTEEMRPDQITVQARPFSPVHLRSERAEYTSEFFREQSAEPQQQSTTVFADFSPQIIELKYGIKGKAQEMCLASEEATYEENETPERSLHIPTPGDMFKVGSPPSTRTPTTTPEPAEKAVSAPMDKETSMEIPVPISVETNPGEEADSQLPHQPSVSALPGEVISAKTTPTKITTMLDSSVFRPGQPATVSTTYETYETKRSIFEQDLYVEEYKTENQSLMDSKGSGTPLSKVCDRIKAWEFHQQPSDSQKQPPATTTSSTAEKTTPEPVRLRPSSISEYRLLFQSPPPTPTHLEDSETKPKPSLDATTTGIVGAGETGAGDLDLDHIRQRSGSVSEFKKRFENFETVTRISSSTAAMKPLLAPKPIFTTTTTMSGVPSSASTTFKPETTSSSSKVETHRVESDVLPPVTSPSGTVSSYKRFFESHEHSETFTSSSTTTTSVASGQPLTSAFASTYTSTPKPPTTTAPKHQDTPSTITTDAPPPPAVAPKPEERFLSTSTLPASNYDFDKGIVSKFKQFFQNYDQQSQPQPASIIMPSPQPLFKSEQFTSTPQVKRTQIMHAKPTFYSSQKDIESTSKSSSSLTKDNVQAKTVSSSTTTKTTTTKVVESTAGHSGFKPTKFVPVTQGEWSGQSDYESDYDSYKIQPVWVPPNSGTHATARTQATGLPKFRPFSPPVSTPLTTISVFPGSISSPSVQSPTSAFTSFHEQKTSTSFPSTGPGLFVGGIKPVPPPKPLISSPGVTSSAEPSAFEKVTTKPQIGPKPTVTFKSPIQQESKQSSLQSTVTKSEETKFLLRPRPFGVSSKPVSGELANEYPEMKGKHSGTDTGLRSPEYFVSFTNPPIQQQFSETSTTSSIPILGSSKPISSKIQDTVRKLYETSTTTSTLKRFIEGEDLISTSPDMEPFTWREAQATSPFCPLGEQSGFYSASSREATPTPTPQLQHQQERQEPLRKSAELVIPIERESSVNIVKPEPIKADAAAPGSEPDSGAKPEGRRFIPTKFIPALTTDEEETTTTEDDEPVLPSSSAFSIRPKWAPTGILFRRNDKYQLDEPIFRPVRGPPVKVQQGSFRSIQKEPGFFMACDFSCEYGIVPTAALRQTPSGQVTNALEILFPASATSGPQSGPFFQQ